MQSVIVRIICYHFVLLIDKIIDLPEFFLDIFSFFVMQSYDYVMSLLHTCYVVWYKPKMVQVKSRIRR